MDYKIKLCNTETKLTDCPIFQVNQFNWNSVYFPVTYGQLCYWKGKGFLLQMTCEEGNPLCTYRNLNDPVYLDSAMEAFLNFDPTKQNYFNFEINAAGVMLVQFGSSRLNRHFLTPGEIQLCTLDITRKADLWSFRLLIPLELIEKYFKTEQFHVFSQITCNFYKISENEKLTHFASFAPVISPLPNFHLPQYFAKGLII